MDWQKGALFLEIRLSLGAGEKALAEARYLAQNRVQRLLPSYFLDAVLDLRLDSFQTVGENIEQNEERFRRLNDLAERGRKLFSSLSSDLGEARIRYEYPLYGERGLIRPFIEFEHPDPFVRILGFEPTLRFSGLVVYAKGEYRAYGGQDKVRLNPALLPKLYDEDMRLVLSPTRCKPEYLRKWGVAAYTRSLDEEPFRERIGHNPLRTMARAVFGKNSTDVLIPNDAARKLLAETGNHTLLQEGRILIIID